MTISEVRSFLDKINEEYRSFSFRLVIKIIKDQEDEVSGLLEHISGLGYAANLQSSAYGDIEVTITDTGIA